LGLVNDLPRLGSSLCLPNVCLSRMTGVSHHCLA
jgi:hypothetical protein